MLAHIRRLTSADLPACLDLAGDRQWLAEEHKWRLLFEIGTVYGVRDDAGDLIATATLTRFADLAAVSMVLVATRYSRRGLGTRLMTHVLAEAGEAHVFLNATVYGRPLYERLGFVTVGTTSTYLGTPTRTGAPGGSRAARAADLPAIRALDARVNGVDRAALMARLPAFVERLRVVEREGVITGYAGAWRNLDTTVIGPVIASSPVDAAALIGDLRASAETVVRLDLDERCPWLHEWARERGLVLRNTADFMTHRGRALPGVRDQWFAPLTQALG